MLLLLLLLLLLEELLGVSWSFCCRRQLQVVHEAGWRGIGLWIGALLERMSLTRKDVVEFAIPPAGGCWGTGGGVASGDDAVLEIGCGAVAARCCLKIPW